MVQEVRLTRSGGCRRFLWFTAAALGSLAALIIGLWHEWHKFGGRWPFLASRLETAFVYCNSVRSSATYWGGERKNWGKCPTLHDLRASGSLGAAFEKDPWGAPFVIRCDTNGYADVFSLGQDGIFGTDDDVRSGMTEAERDRLRALYRWRWRP